MAQITDLSEAEIGVAVLGDPTPPRPPHRANGASRRPLRGGATTNPRLRRS
ncbi:MAG: hypothetical protein NC117_00790 [Pseudoflavonifractor sp.]|nr:hypothetical protein [Pseudoflavonifractor sp.]